MNGYLLMTTFASDKQTSVLHKTKCQMNFQGFRNYKQVDFANSNRKYFLTLFNTYLSKLF